MKKLIYFKDNGLVQAFCQNGEIVPKELFCNNPEKFLDTIVVCYGVVNYEAIPVCKENKIDFIYLDNCYFGNMSAYYTDKKCKKNFYRVVVNNTCLKEIISRKDDRLKNQLQYLEDQYGATKLIEDFKYDGQEILIIPPSGKVLEICNIDVDKWINEVVEQVETQTNFKPNIRIRSRTRSERFVGKPIQEDFKNAYATVSFNSSAAIESLMFGIPIFIYDNTGGRSEIYSAAKVLARDGISNLNDRFFPENRYEWLSHLAYGQFNREEMGNGYARKFILKSLR